MYIHQSTIKSWDRCPRAWKYEQDGHPVKQLSATAFGSVFHHAVHVMERTGDLTKGIDTFRHYWHPHNIASICQPVDVWIGKDSYGLLASKGVESLKRHWDLLQFDDGELLALEFEFAVPMAGTRDRDTGEPHILVGSIDRLAVRRDRGKPYLSVEDQKTGRQHTYLRHNVQGTAYCYASTLPQFWLGWPEQHTDGFAGRGQDLYDRLDGAPRKFVWINANTGTWVNGGFRGPADYRRLAEAVQAVADSIHAEIFPLSLAGEVCEHCFSADTAFWTAEGVKTFKETVGTTQRVLANTGSGGVWVDAPVRRYGRSPLVTVHLARGRARREVRATPDHRWLVRVRGDDTRTTSRVVRTGDLAAGDRLVSLKPMPVLAKVIPSPIGIMAGIVYGDGCAPTGRKTSGVSLFHGKRELAGYFAGHESRQHEDRLDFYGLPRFLKASPNLDESASYLGGWLAGYVATDGHADGTQVTLSSASRESIELARTVAARLGIATYDVRTQLRVGINQTAPSELHSIQLVGSDLPDWFLLRSAHRAKFRRPSRESLTWTVLGIEDRGEIEDVFCVEVPEHENFTLDAFINVMNCSFRGPCLGDTEETA